MDFKKILAGIFVVTFLIVLVGFNSVSAKKSSKVKMQPETIESMANQVDYKGVIISDDMVMKGIQYPAGEACISGIEAGLNLLLYRSAAIIISTPCFIHSLKGLIW